MEESLYYQKDLSSKPNDNEIVRIEKDAFFHSFSHFILLVGQ